MVGRRPDALTALVVVVALAAIAASSSTKLRLDATTGRHLAAESEALAADPSSPAVAADRIQEPAVVAGSARRLVAWPAPAAFIHRNILVHDPTGFLEPNHVLPGGYETCTHVTGPWWTCRVG